MLSIFILTAIFAIALLRENKNALNEKLLQDQILQERGENLDAIKEWVCASKKMEKQVSGWNFAEGKSDQVELWFTGEEKHVKHLAKICFTEGGLKKRVRRVTYFSERGRAVMLPGTPEERIPFEILVNGFRMEKAEKDHLAYFNEVAKEAEKGFGTFDMLRYMHISMDAFLKTFGKNEIAAFETMLRDTFETAMYRDKAIFLVSGLKTEQKAA